ncbi:hypothetical protein [Deinococcus sonorensis]|uniref:Uncharacterized protein n=2 Tax=Deinococcus sonorensis TaxID=309891 RepID=A0AAU7U8F5_9DEIO
MDVHLSEQQWQAFLAGLYERDDRLERREPGVEYPLDEKVDAYIFSGHAEALNSEDIDGDVWGTLEDLEMEAADEDSAWALIRDFYLERGCVLMHIEHDGEWIISEALARRLGLLPAGD